jgi:hypothetical protein
LTAVWQPVEEIACHRDNAKTPGQAAGRKGKKLCAGRRSRCLCVDVFAGGQALEAMALSKGWEKQTLVFQGLESR